MQYNLKHVMLWGLQCTYDREKNFIYLRLGTDESCCSLVDYLLTSVGYKIYDLIFLLCTICSVGRSVSCMHWKCAYVACCCSMCRIRHSFFLKYPLTLGKMLLWSQCSFLKCQYMPLSTDAGFAPFTVNSLDCVFCLWHGDLDCLKKSWN